MGWISLLSLQDVAIFCYATRHTNVSSYFIFNEIPLRKLLFKFVHFLQLCKFFTRGYFCHSLAYLNYNTRIFKRSDILHNQNILVYCITRITLLIDNFSLLIMWGRIDVELYVHTRNRICRLLAPPFRPHCPTAASAKAMMDNGSVVLSLHKPSTHPSSTSPTVLI